MSLKFSGFPETLAIPSFWGPKSRELIWPESSSHTCVRRKKKSVPNPKGSRKNIAEKDKVNFTAQPIFMLRGPNFETYLAILTHWFKLWGLYSMIITIHLAEWGGFSFTRLLIWMKHNSNWAMNISRCWSVGLNDSMKHPSRASQHGKSTHQQPGPWSICNDEWTWRYQYVATFTQDFCQGQLMFWSLTYTLRPCKLVTRKSYQNQINHPTNPTIQRVESMVTGNFCQSQKFFHPSTSATFWPEANKKKTEAKKTKTNSKPELKNWLVLNPHLVARLLVI